MSSQAPPDPPVDVSVKPNNEEQEQIAQQTNPTTAPTTIGKIKSNVPSAGTITLPDGTVVNIPRPIRCAKPNAMDFLDAEGVKHRIYILDRYDEAMRLFHEQNWEELKKFTPYTGQGYKELDYTYLPAAEEEEEGGGAGSSLQDQGPGAL
ncbi:hypothetical protein EJ08DRAFT_738076 [Tothia fuscella]|uniref:Uncharacterized protein n=1 Tax=Tothia fuscella TaxID=1048955 RepID=A0A9P4NI21_9PEZI|nr:hypothetical protein EJ08DRAFT_738076 [Tothia fuscella]